MAKVLAPFALVWCAIKRVAYLVGHDDVREMYGDNPNNTSDEQRILDVAVRANAPYMDGGGGF